ncbi:MAG TPA: hypothetical protein DCX06_12805 [Opitutae bacterium]|nr:hypothetical protein [Opitutae bacterium]
MARRRTSNTPEEDFPMTPMIDMVFLLLVFFMTVSTLAKAEKNVELDLPESSQSDVPKDISDRGTISINAEGVIHIGMTPHTIETMQQVMKRSLAQNPEMSIQVRADQTTAYSDIKKVLRACAEVGAYEVIYATYQAK